MQHTLPTTSRPRILAIIVFTVMALFVVRLFYLQVIRHDYYVNEANRVQLRQWNLPAERGTLYALDGQTPVPLVMNETIYTAWADPKAIKKEHHDEIITTLTRIAGANVEAEFKGRLSKKDTRYQVLARGITFKQAQLIKKADLYGIGFERGVRRVYPEGALASQVTGFVNNEGQGQYGIEGALQKRLKGTDGVLRTVADVRDVPLTVGREHINKAPVDGDDIVLTIDRNVQAEAQEIISRHAQKTGASKGSILVMNPNTGAVMAMANYPTYDPEKIDEIKDIAALNNATIAIPYEAGSVIKTLTVASALDKGLITPDTRYYNSDSVRVGDRTIVNASKGQTGSITMQTALNWSLNTGMVNILSRMGGGSINRQARDTLYDYFYNRYGLAQRTGIELAGESGGILVSPDKMEGNAVRYSNMAFGQGMNVTMLQVASAFSAIVNGGIYHQPTVVAGTIRDGVLTPEKAGQSRRVISQSAAMTTRKMVHDARAAFHGKNDTAGYYIGGKTGTSQVLKNGEYIFEETVASYLGFGGEVDEKTQYVIMVQLSGPGLNLQGNVHAMPVFSDMSNWMINYLKLTPKG